MNMPQPAWAVMLATLGAILALAVLLHPAEPTVATAVLAVAGSLVSGALGAFAAYPHPKSDKEP